jgi:hypothetical protein
MPIQTCQVNGRPGYKAGPSGTCYTYTEGNTQSQVAARNRAERQLKAIKAQQSEKDE